MSLPTPPPFQERVSKRPKQSGAPEEDDSGVEVYYREGEDEMEQLGVLPRVRVTTKWRKRLLGGGVPCVLSKELCCASPILITSFSVRQWLMGSCLSQSSSLTGSLNINNMFIKS